MPYDTKELATVTGKTQLVTMNGKGWELKVWQNMGWHWTLNNGYISVHETSDHRYYCMISDKPDGYGLPIWTKNWRDRNFFTPMEAVKDALKHAWEVVKKLDKIIDECIEATFIT